jgi:photosystem II stability/assembly factor-like uncharacterized protein
MKKILLFILLVISFCANAQFWTEKATGFTTPERGLSNISIVDANVIWANAFDNTTPLDRKYDVKEFTLSLDGGNTWASRSIDLGTDNALLGVSSITAISTTTAWVSVYPESGSFGGIWKTIDGGTNWTKQPTALFNTATSDPNISASYPNFVYFWDANNGVAQGDPDGNEFEIYTTVDGGATWIRVPAANIPDVDTSGLGEWGYFNMCSVSGNTVWFGSNKGRIFKSTDKGLTWTVNTVPSPSIDFELDRFAFSDANKGLLMTYDPVKLFNTVDGGATWNEVIKTGMLYNENIAYIPGTSIVVSTSSANPIGSSYSTDDGVTWIPIDGIAHGTLAFLNSSFGFSGGFTTNATTGGVFKFTGIPLKAPSFDVKNQITAYPNPTNGILNINSENSLIKEASIFDLLGRQVYNPKFSALNNVTLNILSLQTGAYILKVTSDSGETETMKIMKN